MRFLLLTNVGRSIVLITAEGLFPPTLIHIIQVDQSVGEDISGRELVLELRGGVSTFFAEVLLKFMLLWVVGQGNTPTDAFMIKPHVVPFGQVGPKLNPQVTPRLQESPAITTIYRNFLKHFFPIY